MCKDGLVSLTSTNRNDTSLASLKEACAGNKANLVKILAASEGKLPYAERRVQKCVHSKDALEKLAFKVNEAEAELRCSEDHARFSNDNVSERCC